MKTFINTTYIVANFFMAYKSDPNIQAVLEASKTLKHIKSIYIKEHSAAVNANNKITEYRITANLSFELEPPMKSVSKR